jgi:hypothetical protein
MASPLQRKTMMVGWAFESANDNEEEINRPRPRLKVVLLLRERKTRLVAPLLHVTCLHLNITSVGRCIRGEAAGLLPSSPLMKTTMTNLIYII